METNVDYSIEITKCRNNGMSEQWDVGTTGCHILSTLKCVGKVDVSPLRHPIFPKIVRFVGISSCKTYEMSDLFFKKKEAGEGGHLHTH